MKTGRSNYTIQFNCEPNLINNLVQSYIQGNQYELQITPEEQFYKAGDKMLGYRYFNYSISGQTVTIYAWLKNAFGEIPIEQNNLNILATNYRNSLNTLFQEIEKLNNGGTNMNNNKNFAPDTGQPINQNINSNRMNFDPNTGQPLNQNINNNQMNFDPNTGQPINQNMNNNQINFDPNTGQPINQNINNNPMNFNQNTGQPINQNNYQQPTQYNNNQFTQTFQNETTKKQETMCEIGFWLSLFGLLCSIMGVSYGVIIYILNFYFASQGLKTKKRTKAIATIALSIISILIIIIQIILNV